MIAPAPTTTAPAPAMDMGSIRTEVLLLGPQGQRWPRTGVAKGGLDQKGSVRPTEVVEYEIP